MRLESVAPREQDGRDSIARFRAQFKEAALHCLKMLNSEEIQRVYCDFHDDYVVELKENNLSVYEFYQIKTVAKNKEGDPYTLGAVFGFSRKAGTDNPEKIGDSFAGKLLSHTIKFKEACKCVCLVTNGNVDLNIQQLQEAIDSADFQNATLQRLSGNFCKALKIDEVLAEEDMAPHLKKFKIVSGQSHLRPEGDYFLNHAVGAITAYSEISLEHRQARAIIENLCTLVQEKSAGRLIHGISEDELRERASIDIFNLLNLLSLSSGAYKILKDGGDLKATKTVSILKRILGDSEFSEESIANCAVWKIEYDNWYRKMKLDADPILLDKFQRKITAEIHSMNEESIDMDTIGERVESIWAEIDQYNFHIQLSKTTLFGAFLAEIVRAESWS